MRIGRQTAKHGFTLIELMIVVAIVGILASLAIYGVRKYIANAKTAEAKNSLGQMGKDSQTAYEKESMAGTLIAASGKSAVSRSLCLSATASVPASTASIKGAKYQSNQALGADWSKDTAATTPTGFACLKFSMSAPQYYEYSFQSAASGTPTAFTAVANGDLNGDGTLSTFSLLGTVNSTDQNLYVAPTISEVDPEE